MIGFLKMRYCVEILFFFLLSIDRSDKVVIILPFHMTVYENCGMFKTNLKSMGREEESLSTTYNSAFGLLTFSVYREIIRRHSCMLGEWKESSF